MDTEFVTVVATATGRKHKVPVHYLSNPVLSRGIELPPSARAGNDVPATTEPSDAWTRAQLDERAVALGLNPAELRTKADVLDAIADQTPASDPGEGQTPTAGDTEEE